MGKMTAMTESGEATEVEIEIDIDTSLADRANCNLDFF